jgi:hypothetical protein
MLSSKSFIFFLFVLLYIYFFFSFGILLWERTSYKDLDVEKIQDHMIHGGRVKTVFGNSTPEVSQLQEEYKKL